MPPLRAPRGPSPCGRRSYKAFKVADLCFVALYQSVPLLWFALLWRKRGRINPQPGRALAQGTGRHPGGKTSPTQTHQD